MVIGSEEKYEPEEGKGNRKEEKRKVGIEREERRRKRRNGRGCSREEDGKC